jgi:hypothetical protein
MRTAALTLGFLVALVARADLAPPTPPRIPEGIADARGQLGFFRGRDAGIAAVDLSTGEIRWTSSEGEWLLHADLNTVAVAAIDPKSASALRIRFLRVADGRRILESQPIPLSQGLRIPDPRKFPGRTTPSFTIAAWVPPFTREPNARDGRLRVRWEWSFTPAYGYRPPSPEETKSASGVVLIDPTSGQVTRGNDDEREAIPRAVLPPTFRPDPQLLYWAFSDHGASWSSTPTPFWIAGGVQGAFSYEPRGERRLTLIRWRPLEPLRPLQLGQGAEYAPVIAIGGRFVALSEQKDRQERVLLHDLANKATTPIAELPPFGLLCQPPFAILGDRMLCVREGEGEPIDGGMSFARELVSIRARTGERSWAVPLAPRLLPAPVPGGAR